MRNRLHSLLRWASAFGVEPLKTITALRMLPTTIAEYSAFRRQNSRGQTQWKISFSSPNFQDRIDPAGVASGHYFHQDLLVARRIFERAPKRHVDVGSRIDGFVAHVSVFREIEVIDVRPVNAQVANIKFISRDITSDVDGLSACCDSLSCLHALEHFGLGRYGDTVDADGFANGFSALTKMLEPDGTLYLSLPIGEERVEFNAQRVFSLRRVLDLVARDFEMTAFSYVDDNGDLHQDANVDADAIATNLGLYYGCGIFELKKRPS